MASALKQEELQGFRKTLLELRARLRGDLDQLKDEALQGVGGEGSGNLSHMPMHMADLGSENYDQEFTLGLIENEQATLEQIQTALEKLDRGQFGVCEKCRGPIAKNRLQAIPYTQYCIECARALENGA